MAIRSILDIANDSDEPEKALDMMKQALMENAQALAEETKGGRSK